jgi:hypothetical protein
MQHGYNVSTQVSHRSALHNRLWLEINESQLLAVRQVKSSCAAFKLTPLQGTFMFAACLKQLQPNGKPYKSPCSCSIAQLESLSSARMEILDT